jgi:hypothetical protein
VTIHARDDPRHVLASRALSVPITIARVAGTTTTTTAPVAPARGMTN